MKPRLRRFAGVTSIALITISLLGYILVFVILPWAAVYYLVRLVWR